MAVPIDPVGHLGFQSSSRQLGLEKLSDLQVCVRVLDLISSQVFDTLAIAEDARRGVQGEVAGRLSAGVEMLMEPAIWGNEHAAALPGHALLTLAFRPHHREALALQDDDDD